MPELLGVQDLSGQCPLECALMSAQPRTAQALGQGELCRALAPEIFIMFCSGLCCSSYTFNQSKQAIDRFAHNFKYKKEVLYMAFCTNE